MGASPRSSSSAGLSAGLLWGAARRPAVHAVVTALLGWLLAELLVVRLCKVPFTCTYLPGRSEVKTMWPFYFTAFTTFTYSMAGLELQMLRAPRLRGGFVVIVTVAAIATHLLRRRWLAAEPGLRFAEEEPGAMFEGFPLERGPGGARRDPSRGDGGGGVNGVHTESRSTRRPHGEIRVACGGSGAARAARSDGGGGVNGVHTESRSTRRPHGEIRDRLRQISGCSGRAKRGPAGGPATITSPTEIGSGS